MVVQLIPGSNAPRYWTRQGMSLQDVQDRINEVLESIGLTADLIDTVLAARDEAVAAAASAGVSGDVAAALATKLTGPTVPGLRAQFVYKTSDVNAARPGVAANVSIIWDLGVDATTPPTHMGPNDYWLS